MKYQLRSVCVIVVLVMTACGLGCDSIKAPPEGVADGLHIQNYPRIVVTDRLQSGLRFGDVIVKHGTDQVPMRVTVPVRSVIDKHGVNIQYRFEFYDEDDRLMGDLKAGDWRFRDLEPRVQAYLEGGAINISAVDWRLIIRSAQ